MLTSGGYKLQGDYGIFDGNKAYVWGSVSQNRIGGRNGNYYSQRSADTSSDESKTIEATIPKTSVKKSRRSASSHQAAGTGREYYASINIPVGGSTPIEARANLAELLEAGYLELVAKATIWEKGEQVADDPAESTESQQVEEPVSASS